MKDMLEVGILDPYLVKHWGIKLATNAAITVLRVDQVSSSLYNYLHVIHFLFSSILFINLSALLACFFLDYNVMCICQIIMAKPAGGPKAPKQQGHWDKDGWDDEPDKFDTHY